jgi:hypothetical protein
MSPRLSFMSCGTDSFPSVGYVSVLKIISRSSGEKDSQSERNS